MTRFVIFIAYEATDWSKRSAEEQQVYIDGHAAFEAYVESHGRHHSSAALADADRATTIRRVGDTISVTVGPFAETVEMIGGYYEVDLPGLDEAIAACTLLPSAYSLEIRPTIKIEM